MTIDPYEKNESWAVAAEPDDHAKLDLRTVMLGACVAIVALTAVAVLFRPARAQPPSRSPDPVIAEALVGPHRVLLGDYEDGRAFLKFYRVNQELLGDPLIGEHAVGSNPNCVTYRHYISCRSQDPGVRGTQWEYVLLTLGSSSLASGITREVDAPMSPAAKAFADRLTTTGRDWLYWLGRPISRPFCPEGHGECFQAFERQILAFPRQFDGNLKDVRLLPLGETSGY